MKKIFCLEGLDCANCAAKLESAINDIDIVTNASIDFINKRLVLEAVESDFDAAHIKTRAAISKIEPNVTMTEKTDKTAANGEGKAEDITKKKQDDIYLKNQIIRIAGCVVIMLAAALLPELTLITEVLMYITAYLLIGGDILWRAVRNILKGKIFDENFLMSLATVGAFCIGEYPEGVAVMLFYQVGELFQHYAVARSRKSIAGLMNIRPDYANVLVNGEIISGAPEDVEIGDILVVKAGEKIPLDGVITEGTSSVDTAALTGESLPREVSEGDEALSGCINLTGLLHIKVTREYGESTVSKILELVENASSKKASTENFITKFAAVYTPVVVGIALLLAVLPPLFFGGEWHTWVYRALSFLVVSCPCALVISIPLGFFGGIGGASKCGVLIKGGNFLEALTKTQTVVFDKTGTLTEGRFEVTEVKPSAEGYPLLELLAHAELYSNHPISLSIKAAYGKEPDGKRVKDVTELAGRGVKAVVDGKTLLAGNLRLMEENGIKAAKNAAAGTAVHLAVDGVYEGYVTIADKIKEDSARAMAALKAVGVTKTVMLTGDSRAVGEAVAKKLGLNEVYAELLPAGKVEKLEALLAEKPPKTMLAFVGDGINDAPVLARADLGIAMGGLGSDAAIEAADIVLMTDEPSRIATAIKISRRTLGIVKQNIAFAIIVKVLVLALVAFGVSTMWEAVFADVGVSVIAILNSMRALGTKKAG